MTRQDVVAALPSGRGRGRVRSPGSTQPLSEAVSLGPGTPPPRGALHTQPSWLLGPRRNRSQLCARVREPEAPRGRRQPSLLRPPLTRSHARPTAAHPLARACGGNTGDQGVSPTSGACRPSASVWKGWDRQRSARNWALCVGRGGRGHRRRDGCQPRAGKGSKEVGLGQAPHQLAAWGPAQGAGHLAGPLGRDMNFMHLQS